MGFEKAVDLRAVVREVLQEALAARGKGRGAAPAASQPARITSGAELQAFVAHLASPGVIEAVRAGTLHFTLATGPGKAPARRSNAPSSIWCRTRPGACRRSATNWRRCAPA